MHPKHWLNQFKLLDNFLVSNYPNIFLRIWKHTFPIVRNSNQITHVSERIEVFPIWVFINFLNPIIQISSCKLYSLVFLRRNDRMNPIFYVSFLFAKFWIEVSIWLLLSCPVDALTLRAPIELSCRRSEPRAVLIWGSWCSFH